MLDSGIMIGWRMQASLPLSPDKFRGCQQNLKANWSEDNRPMTNNNDQKAITNDPGSRDLASESKTGGPVAQHGSRRWPSEPEI